MTGHTEKPWPEAHREQITRMYPLRRLGKPSDGAPTVAFLASDATRWITGRTLSVSGGYSTIG